VNNILQANYYPAFTYLQVPRTQNGNRINYPAKSHSPLGKVKKKVREKNEVLSIMSVFSLF
jgi:hypothetical protein